MANNKDELGRPISQSASFDTTDTSGRPETFTPQSPADLAGSRLTFIDLFTSAPKAWQTTEAKLLGEKSPEELATKRDVFIGLMSGISKAWQKMSQHYPAQKETTNQTSKAAASRPLQLGPTVNKGSRPSCQSVQNNEASSHFYSSNNRSGVS